MASINSREWQAIEHAAKEYEQYAAQIEQVKKDISLLKQGDMKLNEISSNQERVDARMGRERKALQEVDAPMDFLLERVMGRPDFQEACILDRLVNFANAVGRVVLSNGMGTGWLIGEQLLITNNHVLPSAELAASAVLNMGYERSVLGRLQNGENYQLRPDLFFMTPPRQGAGEFLDFTIVGVDRLSSRGKPLSAYGHVVLDGGLGKAIEGENCMVIQHPEGDYKKVVLRDVRLLAFEDIPGADAHLYYESDTLPGSSGSMVVGLGTGEIIALHNAGVPRRDAQGNYLKKNGSIFRTGQDSPDDIDWMANQGVRVSRIVRAMRALPLPASMEKLRQELLSAMENRVSAVVLPKESSENGIPKPQANWQPQADQAPGPVVAQPSGNGAPDRVHKFLVKVKRGHFSVAVVSGLLQSAFQGCTIESLVEDEESVLKYYLYVSIPATEDPWVQAAKLEAVEGVEEADPDLPRYTGVGGPEELPGITEDQVPDPLHPQELFGRRRRPDLGHWENSRYLQGKDRAKAEDRQAIRRWHQQAINFNENKVRKALGETGLRELTSLRIAQFDTGYTEHSKVKEGFNYALDFDVVDGGDDDAQDTPSFIKLLRHYGHGSRTGSLLIGKHDSLVPDEQEGNIGLLNAVTEGQADSLKITPFRVTKSVILIRRIREVIKAANLALSSGYDIITMSLGILPGTRALYEIVKEAYEQGIIWCAAAGNEVRLVVAPGKYPGVICVAASNPDDTAWSGSCRGETVDITAPGEDIYVPIFTDTGESMNYGNGTSYATPQVAAAASFWLAKNKTALDAAYGKSWQRVEAFRYCLQQSARKVAGLGQGFGWGILDVEELLKTPLPDSRNLKHAYQTAFESFAEGVSLAERELAYKGWMHIYSKDGQQDGFNDGQALKESFSSRQLSQRPATLELLRNLNRQAGKKGSLSAQESISADRGPISRETAFEQLKILASSTEQGKPRY